MPGWSIDRLPAGYTVKRVAEWAQPGSWYVVRGYGQTSGRLDPASPTFQADLDAFVDGCLPAGYAAGKQQALLEMRNRWLAQTDSYILGQLPGDLPADVVDAITASLDTIRAWRQQLRDYPTTVTDWADPPALPTPPTLMLPSGRQLIIVT